MATRRPAAARGAAAAPKLSAQEKLALALSSAGSMRALARQLGVTHQKVGRWLREGQESVDEETGEIRRVGIVQIPESATDDIDRVFRAHVKVSRAVAKKQSVPFDAAIPIYMERRELKKGGLGDRVISGPTEFIPDELRREWIRNKVQQRAFYKVNVRSVINLRQYFDGVAADELASGRRRGITRERLSAVMLRDFTEREHAQKPGVIVDETMPFAMYTQSENIQPGTEARRVVRGVEEKLAQKHSPATGEKGTHFADEFLLQLLPPGYVPTSKKKARDERQAKERAAKRGRKPRRR